MMRIWTSDVHREKGDPSVTSGIARLPWKSYLTNDFRCVPQSQEVLWVFCF